MLNSMPLCIELDGRFWLNFSYTTAADLFFMAVKIFLLPFSVVFNNLPFKNEHFRFDMAIIRLLYRLPYYTQNSIWNATILPHI